MDKKQLENLEKKLKESKSSLEESLLHFAKKDGLEKGNWDTVFPKIEGSDMEEKADEVEEYSSLLPVEHALELKLKSVNDALEKIKKNSYGNCESCGKEIPFKRLSITPEIKTCKNCS
jgi:DnaK suppressor protein